MKKYKVLIVSKFLYARGGAEMYAISLERLLKKHGHEVCFYSMQYPLNIPVNENRNFAEEVSFFNNNPVDKIKATLRIFGHSIRKSFEHALNEFQPDIVHLNNIHSYLSPMVAQISYEKNIPVVWTAHDHKMVCPGYSCLHKGKECEDCLEHLSFVIKKRCIKGSYLQSICAYMEAVYWSRKKLQKYTNRFIAPSKYLKDIMVKGGFDESKVTVLLHSVPRNIDFDDIVEEKENYYCYVGRLSEEKGVAMLIEAAKKLPYKLMVIGDGPQKDELSAMAKKCSHIELVGFKEWDDLKTLIGKARFIVTPSKVREILGLVNIEAQILGTPVLGANIGGIPETIDLELSGDLFEPNNVLELKKKISAMFLRQFDYKEISNNARLLFSEDNYYDSIMKIFEEVLEDK